MFPRVPEQICDKDNAKTYHERKEEFFDRCMYGVGSRKVFHNYTGNKIKVNIHINEAP
jgi:hypothetical protein